MLQSSLDTYKSEYDELWQNWRDIDNKAQTNITIAGILVAAVFAFINFISANIILCEKILLLAALLLISISILASLAALFVRRVISAPLGKDYNIMIKELLEAEGEISLDRRINLLKDTIKLWDKVNDELGRINKLKAIKLVVAQVILLISILSIVVLSIMTIF